jgi:hypothetical protein
MSLRRADPSPRGVLPTVVCVWVWSSENKQPQHLLWVDRKRKDYETKRKSTCLRHKHYRLLLYAAVQSLILVPKFQTKLLSPSLEVSEELAEFRLFFFQWLDSPVGLGIPSVEVSRSHSVSHTTLDRTPLDEQSAHRWDLYQKHTTFPKDRHLCPRRDSNSQSQQASGRWSNPRHRPRGHRDGLNSALG